MACFIVFLLPVWLFGTRTRQYRGQQSSAGRREPLTVKTGNDRAPWPFQDTFQHNVPSLREFNNNEPTHPLLFCLSVWSPLWKTLAPGRCHLKGWWRVQRVAAASGSSCGQSSARRTWCSGSPARTSKRRPTRLWWRRKSVKSTRTSSRSFPRKRWATEAGSACCYVYNAEMIWWSITGKLVISWLNGHFLAGL